MAEGVCPGPRPQGLSTLSLWPGLLLSTWPGESSCVTTFLPDPSRLLGSAELWVLPFLSQPDSCLCAERAERPCPLLGTSSRKPLLLWANQPPLCFPMGQALRCAPRGLQSWRHSLCAIEGPRLMTKQGAGRGWQAVGLGLAGKE